MVVRFTNNHPFQNNIMIIVFLTKVLIHNTYKNINISSSRTLFWQQDTCITSTYRQQYVTLNNCRSTYLTLSAGVPQGSVLFLIYANDLSMTLY